MNKRRKKPKLQWVFNVGIIFFEPLRRLFNIHHLYYLHARRMYVIVKKRERERKKKKEKDNENIE